MSTKTATADSDTRTSTGGVHERLLKAIRKHSGMEDDEIMQAGEHGADAGWAGFTYTADTVAFFKANRAAIRELVAEMASDLGEQPLEMVAGFGCLGGRELRRGGSEWSERDRQRKLAEYYPSVSRCLYGGRLTEDDNNVANALAWFALEEVGRWLENERERAGE